MTNFTQIAKNFKLLNPGRLDSWYGPYNSILDANNNVPSGIRRNKIVGILTVDGTVDYWWKNSTLNSSLVKYVSPDVFIFDYKGVYDASTGIPILTDSTGELGWLYDVTGMGVNDFGSGNISLNQGDQLRHDGIRWNKIEAITSVAPSSSQEFVI